MSHKLVAFSGSIEKWPTLLLILDLGIGGALPPLNKYHPKSPRKLGLTDMVTYRYHDNMVQ